MKTPTKEQIEMIYQSEYVMGTVSEQMIKIIVEEWEKIRED